MSAHRLSPMELAEDPALGVLLVSREGLHAARFALCAAHPHLLEEDFRPTVDPHAAAASAYAMAMMSPMRALEETLQSYRMAVERIGRVEALEDDEDEPLRARCW
jgi:hypothetical protein